MVDVLTGEQRARCMSRIKGRDTKPEMVLRSFLHAEGLRYRLHRKDLPGKPDLVFKQYGCVIFVHGCFWHRHVGCQFTTTPSSNKEFWSEKLSKNAERDKRQIADLIQAGWRVIVVWECGLRNASKMPTWLVDEIRTGQKMFFEWPATGKPCP